jgi:hypothetical protein
MNSLTNSFNIERKGNVFPLPQALQYPSFSALPSTGESTVIYLIQDTGYFYRWTGSSYVQTLSPGLSAYQVAVYKGFEGSEEEWLNTLISTVSGQKGDNGTPVVIRQNGGHLEWKYEADDEWQLLSDKILTKDGNLSGITDTASARVNLEVYSQEEVDNELSAHTSRTDNPHAVTKAQVGLGNVPNVDARSRSTHTGTQPSSTISDFSESASAAAPVQSVAGKTGNVSLNKGDVGLGNVDDTPDSGKPISTAQQAALDGKAPLSHNHAISQVTGLQAVLDGKQAAGSYAALDGTGKVPSYQLPSYVDDVLEFATLAAFPAMGETGKIYVSTGTNRTYRWSGSSYVEMTSSPGSTDAVPEGATNLYFTAARAVSALASTLAFYASQAWVTAQGFATTAGVSSAISALVTGVSSVAGKTGAVTLVKGDVGLGNVDNTSDANKPISTATQTALDGKAPTSHTHDYSTLAGLPIIPPAQVNSDWNATSGLAQILNKPTLFSGAYGDLTGKPFIPSTTDGLTEGTSNLYFTSARALSAVTWATLTGKPTFSAVAFSGSYADLTGAPSLSAVATSGSASDLSAGTLPLARLNALVARGDLNNNFTVGQTITAAANTSALTASYSVTGANTTAIIDLSGVWNTTGVANGILFNITDTASNASSLLLDLRVGGASRCSITKSGSITASGVISCTQIFGSSLRAETGGATRIISGGSLGWSSSSSNPAIASDLTLFRDAANILALRNGTNAQTSRVYGTWTDVNNGRWLSISTTTAGLVTLTATGNGTGATGNLLKLTAPVLIAASSVTLATNGDLAFEATSNTSLTIRYRGSDGTTRSAALTLA